MDRRERSSSPTDALLAVLAAKQAEIWTALPGVVKAFRKATGSGPGKGIVVDVQCSLQMFYRKPGQTGDGQWIDVPLLLDCPVMFPGGGGFTLTFPVTVGDECLVVFASRCIDAWFESGGNANQQAEMRLHDLSDGFAFVGVRSRPRTLSPEVNGTDVELRSDDGTTKIALKSDGSILLKSPVSVTLDTPTTHMTGNLQVDGNIHADGDVVADTVSLHDHIHHGVDRGTQDTDPPTP